MAHQLGHEQLCGGSNKGVRWNRQPKKLPPTELGKYIPQRYIQAGLISKIYKELTQFNIHTHNLI